MKKKLIVNIFIFLIGIFSFIVTSCSMLSSTIKSTFENIVYDEDKQTLTFDLSISDEKSLGSDYKVILKNTSSKSIVSSKDITSIEKTTYSFENVERAMTYTLYVTCTYNGESDYQIKGSKTGTTGGEDYLTSLGITYENQTVEYTGQAQQIYATYNLNGVSTNIKEGETYSAGYESYVFYYSNTLSQIEVGEYSQTLSIYKCSGIGYYNTNKELVESVTRTLTITRAKSLFDISDIEVEYTGSPVSMPLLYEGLNYTYKDSDGNVIDSIVNPGTYTVSFNFEGDSNYEAFSGEFNVVVAKKTISSTITNQTTKLNEDGKASLNIDDSYFNIEGLNYTLIYKDSDGNILENNYVTSLGTYYVTINIEETEFIKGFSVTIKLNVVDKLDSNSVVVSNVEYFSVETGSNWQKTINYYTYINLYNSLDSTISLSDISLYLNNKLLTLSGEIKSNESLKVLVYSNASKISSQSFIGYTTYDFTSYADTSVKLSYSTLSSITTVIDSESITYKIDTTYSDYFAYLSSRENLTFTYKSLSSINDSISAVQSFGYTTQIPSVSYSFDFDTISQTRIADLYNLVATDGLGNTIEVTSNMVDISQIIPDNVGKQIDVEYNIVDSYGNVCSFIKTFTLVDEEAPEIELSSEVKEGSLSIYIKKDEQIDLTKYFTVYDLVDGYISVSSDMISDGGLGDASVMGKYKVVITATDSSNNTSTYSITIYVDTTDRLSSYIGNETIKSSLSGQSDAMPSTGNVNVLVVPIFFKSSNMNTTFIKTLNTVFNDTSSSLTIGSVKEYYQNASYNKLNLSFDIYSASYISPLQSSTYYDKHITELLDYVLDELDSNVDFTKYDSDSDGVIDAIWFVYDINYDQTTSYFWAWTSDMGSNLSTRDSKSVGKVCFASYEFTNASDSYYSSYPDSNSSTGLSARTYIHETGHLLGLYDYYDYDYDKTVGYHHTMYGCSMMDANLGDFDAASKLLLGWVDPIVVSSDQTITMSSTALNGDVVCIAKETRINNTIFQELILLEFWTPDGLNKADSSLTFGSKHYGIRVLHLDATINYVNGVPTLTTGTRQSYFKYNNTDDDSMNFLETLAYNTSATYNSQTQKYTRQGTILFEDTKTVFGSDVHSDFKYHDNTSIDFTFNITSISSSSVTLNINFK